MTFTDNPIQKDTRLTLKVIHDTVHCTVYTLLKTIVGLCVIFSGKAR